jgi:hypothetical protein
MSRRDHLQLRLLNGDVMNDRPTPLGGTCSARFDPLRELFAAKLESGEDLGASVALNIDGEMAVDLWGALLPGGRPAFGGDTGGSAVIIDTDRCIAFAYVMNKMAPSRGTIAAALAQRVADIVKR